MYPIVTQSCCFLNKLIWADDGCEGRGLQSSKWFICQFYQQIRTAKIEKQTRFYKKSLSKNSRWKYVGVFHWLGNSICSWLFGHCVNHLSMKHGWINEKKRNKDQSWNTNSAKKVASTACITIMIAWFFSKTLASISL